MPAINLAGLWDANGSWVKPNPLIDFLSSLRSFPKNLFVYSDVVVISTISTPSPSRETSPYQLNKDHFLSRSSLSLCQASTLTSSNFSELDLSGVISLTSIEVNKFE